MPTHTFLNGLTITYPEPAPEVAAFLDRVRAAAADPAVNRDDLLRLAFGLENPLLDKDRYPGHALVTRAVLDNPIHAILHDLVNVKEVNLGLVDLEATIAGYTISVPEAAKKLGRTPAAIRAAIAAHKLDGWIRNGQWYLRPASVELYKPSNRGRSNLGRKKEKSDSPAAEVRAKIGGTPGGSLAVRLEGKDELVKDAEGYRFPAGWKRAIVRSVMTTSKGKTMRVFALEPAPGETELIRVGDRFIEGAFKVVEKVNNIKQALAAWKAGV